MWSDAPPRTPPPPTTAASAGSCTPRSAGTSHKHTQTGETPFSTIHGMKGGSSTGGRAGWLVTARLIVRSPAPPSSSVEVSLSKTPHPNCRRAGCRLAWWTAPSVFECVHQWANVRQYCKALWMKALYKCSPLSINQHRW